MTTREAEGGGAAGLDCAHDPPSTASPLTGQNSGPPSPPRSSIHARNTDGEQRLQLALLDRPPILLQAPALHDGLGQSRPDRLDFDRLPHGPGPGRTAQVVEGAENARGPTRARGGRCIMTRPLGAGRYCEGSRR